MTLKLLFTPAVLLLGTEAAVMTPNSVDFCTEPGHAPAQGPDQGHIPCQSEH